MNETRYHIDVNCPYCDDKSEYSVPLGIHKFTCCSCKKRYIFEFDLKPRLDVFAIKGEGED